MHFPEERTSVSGVSSRPKPALPAKPDLKALQKTTNGRETCLNASTRRRTPIRPAPPPPARRTLVNANGVSLRESNQDILAKKHQQLISASLILKASGGKQKTSSRPLSYIPKDGNHSKTPLFASFFNRLSSLRRSFNPGKSSSYAHQDWTSFFPRAGLEINPCPSSSSEEEAGANTYAEIDESLHGIYLSIPKDVPIAPPRRKRPANLRRSLSFSDALVIAQAVVEGDGGLIKELYPAFPCSSEPPLYAIVDLSRKKKHRRTLQEMSPYRRGNLRGLLDSGGGLTEDTEPLIGGCGMRNGHEEDVSSMYKPEVHPNSSLDFYTPKEPPLVISPWNSRTASSLHDNLIVDCSSTPPKIHPHPYAQRAVSQHYGSHPEKESDHTSSEIIGLRISADDSFQSIMDTADSSILQAESILSTLRLSPVPRPPEDEDDAEGGPSDIESNIRRLEMTQAKINAALDTFRQVQQHKNRQREPRENRGGGGPPPGRRKRQQRSSEQGNSSSIRKGTSHSTLVEPPSGMESPNNPDCSSNRSKKPGLFRRHSFNLQYNNNNANASSTTNAIAASTSREESSKAGGYSSWYELEGPPDAVSAASQEGNESGLSDSEGGGIRRRIRGLFGSFGKGSGSSASASGGGTSMFYTGHKPQSSQQQQQQQNASSDLFSQTVGEFTRRIESLNRPQEDENQSKSSTTSSSCSSHAQQHPTGASSSSYSRLKYHSALSKNNSNDSSSLGSCHLSNRHSVISAHSCSSYEHEDDESDEDDELNHKNPSSVSSSGPPDEEEECTDDPNRRKENTVFYIAREIMTSERVFVDVLHLLNVEFREFIESKRRSGKKLIPDSDLYRIFSNLCELYALNKDLLSDFEDRIRNWSSLPKISDIIVRKGPFLKLYTSYIREFSDVNLHFDECLSKYQKFAKVVKEFESLERCRHLKIKHFLLKPVQRLPQYKLLLEDYLKHLDPASSIDFDDTTNALRIVSEAAEHANDTIRQGDKFRRMLKLQSRLGDQELIRPGRDLIKEGELLKISRKGIGPRYFILLSDVLLYATYTSSNRSDSSSLRVSYSIPLNTLSVRLLPHYETEFSVSSPVRSCTLRAASLSERNEWIEALNQGIEEHRNRKATFLPNELSLPSDQLDVVGNCAPVWIPDRRVTMCQNCTVEFSVLVRRHHCRACGKVVCASCSGNRAPLRYKGFEVGRVCDDCFDSLERELGHVDNLRHRFKKRHCERGPGHPGGHPSGPYGPSSSRYVPGRLKVRAVGEGSQMSGYLKRRLPKSGKWKRMWYVLKDRVLYAYRASEDTVATDTFPVLGFTLDTLSDKNFELYEGESADLVFQLTHPGSESLIFCAENDNVSEKWITALGEAVKLAVQTPEIGNLIEL